MEAFEVLYARFRKPVFSYVRSRVPEDEVARELTQEVFMRAFRFRDTYERTFAFSTWLWAIARNTVTDHFRARRSSLEAGERDTDFLPEDIPCPESSAETLVLRKDQKRGLLRLMRSLTRMQKRVLWLRVIHQLSFPEISRKLGLSLPSVKNLALRARMTLATA